MHDELQQQEKQRGMRVVVDVLPEIAPSILLGDEDVPVSVVLDILRCPEPKHGDQTDQNDDKGDENGGSKFGLRFLIWVGCFGGRGFLVRTGLRQHGVSLPTGCGGKTATPSVAIRYRQKTF